MGLWVLGLWAWGAVLFADGRLPYRTVRKVRFAWLKTRPVATVSAVIINRQASAAPDSAVQTPVAYPRLLLMLGAAISLIVGLNAGLFRLGAHSLTTDATLGNLHGPLMIFGFLGTVIGLERAVALQTDRGRFWPYVAPLSAIAGGVSAILTARGILPEMTLLSELGVWNAQRAIPSLLWAGSMVTLLGVYLFVATRRQLTAPVLIEILSAAVGAVGVLLWGKGYEIGAIVHWWLAFIILTILAERLELAHILFRGKGLDTRIVAESALFTVTLTVATLLPPLGFPLMGAALLLLVADVGWHDVARKLVRSTGLPRFSAAAMLAAYTYAAIAALTWVFIPHVFSGYTYDVTVHSITIGFTLSMIVAHAPVIMPAVIRRDIPYHPVSWLLLAAIHVALLVRIFGASHTLEYLWRLGGTLGVTSLLAFALTTAFLTIRGRR